MKKEIGLDCLESQMHLLYLLEALGIDNAKPTIFWNRYMQVLCDQIIVS